MKSLLWYTVPGAFVAVALALSWPELAQQLAVMVSLGALTPVIGFFLHQTYRLLFEWRTGFDSESRPVLRYIKDDLASEVGLAIPDANAAFLVWEIAFYHKDFPEPFRGHDKDCWHYVLSFWSVSLACCFGLAIAVVGYLHHAPRVAAFAVATFQAIAILVFYYKGRLTHRSLMEQEVAVAKVQRELLIDVMFRITQRDRGTPQAPHSNLTRPPANSRMPPVSEPL